MATKTARKAAKQEMTKFFDFVEKQTGIALVGDRADLDRHYKFGWKSFDDNSLSDLVEAWKYNLLYTKPYINGKLRNYIISEIRRGVI